MRKTEDKEKATTVEADNKVKVVAGVRCWKGVSLRALQVSGELFELFAFPGG